MLLTELVFLHDAVTGSLDTFFAWQGDELAKIFPTRMGERLFGWGGWLVKKTNYCRG